MLKNCPFCLTHQRGNRSKFIRRDSQIWARFWPQLVYLRWASNKTLPSMTSACIWASKKSQPSLTQTHIQPFNHSVQFLSHTCQLGLHVTTTTRNILLFYHAYKVTAVIGKILGANLPRTTLRTGGTYHRPYITGVDH